jgi:uncharacterized protein YggU (UPF0235/DUF167 family)
VPAWRALDGGVELAVRAKPRSARVGIDAVVKEADGSEWLVVRVTAPAEEGRANAAVQAEIARLVGLSRSAVTLVAGQSARRKRFRIAGDPDVILSDLAKLTS